jgi:hypothetical protein
LPLHNVKLSPEDEEVENVLTAVPVEVENETEYVVEPPIENKRQEMRIWDAASLVRVRVREVPDYKYRLQSMLPPLRRIDEEGYE